MRATKEKRFGVWCFAESKWATGYDGHAWTASTLFEAEYMCARMTGWHGGKYEVREIDTR